MERLSPPRPAKKAKKNSQKKHKPKTKKKYIDSYIPQPCPWKFEVFNIFPDHIFADPRLAFHMSFFTNSVKQQESMLQTFTTCPFKNMNIVPDTVDAFWSPSLSKGIYESLQKVRTLRFTLRKFLHMWRFKHITPSNTEDIVTLSNPNYPIWIVDWVTKKRYCFEASTLMKDITSRLLEHDGFFEDPQPPRNPLTNLPLTQTQLISIWNQLYNSPVYPSAAFTEFRRANFAIPIFMLHYNLPLQLYAFRQTMKDPKHIDYQERLIDFIEYAYDQESIDCFTQSYKYAIQHYSDHDILKSWTKLCLDFYEAGILYSKNPQVLQQVQDTILTKTIDLLPKQDELRLLRNSDLRLRRTLAPRRRVVHIQQEIQINTLIAGRSLEDAAEQITELLNAIL